MSDTLKNEAKSARDHLVYLHMDAGQEDGIHALRHNQYKAHFITQGGIFSKNEDSDCSDQKEVRFQLQFSELKTLICRST